MTSALLRAQLGIRLCTLMHSPAGNSRPRCGIVVALLALLILGQAVGCASTKYVEFRKVPRNPLDGPLELLSWSGPKPTARTLQLLRRYDLEESANDETLTALQEEFEREPTPEKAYACAELAYIRGNSSDMMGQKEAALNYYGAAVAFAYLYLFDPRFQGGVNHYDPQFRGASDIYNTALEGALRIANARGELVPGSVQKIFVGDKHFDVHIVTRGPWHAEDFDHFEFSSDYEVKGLNNRHHNFGLGVPLIAVRKQHEGEHPAEGYYPPGLSFPVTAFLRVLPHKPNESQPCVLELHDPLASNTVAVANRIVPLEADMSTALAYFLDHPQLQQTKAVATIGLLNPSSAKPLTGLYMLEPYDPDRIPVIMVHGLWSSPLTWMEMFNDLRSFPDIRNNYQFWFYLYPTGQPFWASAAQMRDDLDQMRAKLDPQRKQITLDQMVLVGHSMGGLVSRLQTIESRDDFWRIVSERRFEDLKVDDEGREELAKVLFFRPNPSIRRVVTIGTPHRGSEFANDTTRWLGRKLIRLPSMLVQRNQELIRDNPDFFRETDLLTIPTSIDSLAPDSPILPVMLNSEKARWVKYHNIVGLAPNEGFLGQFAGEGDGIVSFESAHLEDVQSEIVVPADHVTVHQHPRAILEVRRILAEHLLDYHATLATMPRLKARSARFQQPLSLQPLVVPDAERKKAPLSTAP